MIRRAYANYSGLFANPRSNIDYVYTIYRERTRIKNAESAIKVILGEKLWGLPSEFAGDSKGEPKT
jgi:hypothetical protein